MSRADPLNCSVLSYEYFIDSAKNPTLEHLAIVGDDWYVLASANETAIIVGRIFGLLCTVQ